MPLTGPAPELRLKTNPTMLLFPPESYAFHGNARLKIGCRNTLAFIARSIERESE